MGIHCPKVCENQPLKNQLNKKNSKLDTLASFLKIELRKKTFC